MNPILMLTADRSVTFTATVVISGILIVVGVLLLLICVFALFGKIVPVIERKTRAMEEKSAARKAEKKAKKVLKENVSNAVNSSVSEKPAVNTPPVPAPAPVVEEGISGEVVAAIAAAVAMTEGGSAVVRSIKKKNIGGRNPWAQAANIDNTRPF
ncbi:MAG: OadG family protein [Acetobacter sp.]|nr:OadG family protein [Bacteroides sp.]MCM1341775.1 OadG family protein [Acetobacter sp.]MCM1433118.1 OadG family protein [Clostridiales bacterium]